MKPKCIHVAIIVVLLTHYVMCAPLVAEGEKPPMKFETSSHISRQILQTHCNNSFYQVTVLKNSQGLIGGYVLRPSVMDSPIPYLDCNGNSLTMFHIFDSNGNKENAMKIIEPLLKEFPIQEPLDCRSDK